MSLTIHNYVTSILIFDHLDFWTVFFGVTFVLSIASSAYLLWKAQQKAIMIKQPQKGAFWNETYSVFSMWLIRLVQGIMLLEIAQKSIFLFALMASDQVFNTIFFKGPINVSEACTSHDEDFGPLAYTPIGFYLLQVLPIFQLNLSDLLFLFQAFEWKVMNHLVDFQKHKSVDEIQADLQRSTNLPIKLTLKSKTQSAGDAPSPTRQSYEQASYRQSELVLRTKLIITFALFLLLYIFFILILYSQVIEVRTEFWSFTSQGAFVAFQICILLFELHEFCRIYSSMKTCHKYEFERTKASMKAQMLGAALTHLLWMIFIFQNIKHQRESTKKWVCSHADRTENPWQLFLDITLYGIVQFQIPIYIVAFTIICLKSSQDILQGVSKLDYLMTVSIFQINKKRKDQRPVRPSANFETIQSFVRDSSSQGSDDYIEQEDLL